MAVLEGLPYVNERICEGWFQSKEILYITNGLGFMELDEENVLSSILLIVLAPRHEMLALPDHSLQLTC
jgi:hypothetical protein